MKFLFPFSNLCPVCSKSLHLEPMNDSWWGIYTEIICYFNESKNFHFYSKIEDNKIKLITFKTNKFIVQNIFSGSNQGTSIYTNDPSAKVLYCGKLIWINDLSQSSVLNKKIETLLLLQ